MVADDGERLRTDRAGGAEEGDGPHDGQSSGVLLDARERVCGR
jgi:hypothetical protein